MIDVCMFMYRNWRTSTAGVILCLVLKFKEKKEVRGWPYTQIWTSYFIVFCTLVIHSVLCFRCIIFIIPMSAVYVSINFNWLLMYSNLCILCFDQTVLDYDCIMTCRSHLIYISIHWVYMFDPWGQSTKHVWSNHCSI